MKKITAMALATCVSITSMNTFASEEASNQEKLKSGLTSATAMVTTGALAAKDKTVEIYKEQKEVAKEAKNNYLLKKCMKEKGEGSEAVCQKEIDDKAQAKAEKKKEGWTSRITKGLLGFKDKVVKAKDEYNAEKNAN